MGSGSAISGNARGILLAIGGASVISFDGLLIRLQALPPPEVLFWRGLGSGAAFAGFVIIGRWTRTDGARPEGADLKALLSVITLIGVGTLAWVFSLTHTAVANTLVLVAASPVLTGLVARVVLGERLPTRTWFTGSAVLIGVLIVFSSSVGQVSMLGDVLAVVNTGLLALLLVALRRHPKVDTLLALSVSGFVTAVVVSPWGLHLPDARSLLPVVLNDLVVVPVGLVMVSWAPRYLPAGEVGLLLLAETILGPLWVWLVIGERISLQVAVSGAIILSAIAAHLSLGLGRQQVGHR